MKKWLTSLIIALLCTGLVTTSVQAKGKPEWAGKKEPVKNEVRNQGQTKKLEERIRVRGMNLKFDVPPVIKEGRVLIPVRAVMNGLGAQVEWNGETRTVIITRGVKVIILNLATGETTVNGELITIDVPAQSINNRTFVPLRFVAQTLGEKVNYDENTGDITIGDETTVPADGSDTNESTNASPDDTLNADNTGDADEMTGDSASDGTGETTDNAVTEQTGEDTNSPESQPETQA